MPASEKSLSVYIAASRSRVLYTGVTRNLDRRMLEHKSKTAEGFTSDYNCCRLVYFETYDDPARAIAREKQIKRWRREKKIALIEKKNPFWKDLAAHLDEKQVPPLRRQAASGRDDSVS